jgi:NitT/TauT family transport system ATP-binding protein
VTPFVEVRDVALRYAAQGADEGTLAVEGLTSRWALGRVRRGGRAVGLRQVEPDEARHRAAFPDAGRGRVAGAAVRGPVSVAGMAFQNPVMLPWRLTDRQRAPAARGGRAAPPAGPAEAAGVPGRAEALLAQVGLAGQGGKYPWQLSGGMQQRASLCRALIHEPQLLMLDEPFGALDAFTREELWQVIRDLQAEKRCTTVLVTHDLREAVFLADRILVMSARPGRVIVERVVPLPRPRPIEVQYEKAFTDLVAELRGHIAEARG